MADNSNFADTNLPIRDAFIVSGDYVIDPTKVVAVSSVYPCAQSGTNRFTVLTTGGHEVYISAGSSAIKPSRQLAETEKMRMDFLCQWRSLTNSRLDPS